MPELRTEDRGPVRVLTIDGEARMNVLSPALIVELAEHARKAAADERIRAVVVTGAGSRAFCAGANLKERRGWSEDDIRHWLRELHGKLRELERCPKPWIAAINGLALGGGCELALACDLRVMDPAAQTGLTEVRIGIIPGGGGTVRLARVIGMGRARDMILTARRVEAEEALQIGLINRGERAHCRCRREGIDRGRMGSRARRGARARARALRKGVAQRRPPGGIGGVRGEAAAAVDR